MCTRYKYDAVTDEGTKITFFFFGGEVYQMLHIITYRFFNATPPCLSSLSSNKIKLVEKIGRKKQRNHSFMMKYSS